MPRLHLTGLARIPILVLHQVDQFGLDPEEMVRAAGFDPEELRDPDQRVEVTKLLSLWRVVSHRVPDPALGLRLGQSVDVRDLGLVGYAMLNSTLLGEALRRLTRYSHILSEALEYGLEPGVDRTRLVLGAGPQFDALPPSVDARIASALTIIRQLTGTELVPVEVHFVHPAPIDGADHRRLLRSPVLFTQPRNVIVLHNRDLELPVISADPTLGDYLLQLAEQTLQSLGRSGTFADRVRRTIWEGLSSGNPGLQGTAAALGVSVRTLQRRLRDEGTTFADILDELRQQMALSLLRDPTLAVYEIAFLLGYSEASTFHRAFRRWKGVAPHEFRQTLH